MARTSPQTTISASIDALCRVLRGPGSGLCMDVHEERRMLLLLFATELAEHEERLTDAEKYRKAYRVSYGEWP